MSILSFIEPIWTWIIGNTKLFGIILAIIVLVAVTAWRAALYYAKLEATRKKVNELPCTEHKNTINNLHIAIGTVDSINEQVTAISKWIMHIDDKMIDQLSQKCSPRVMTQLGKNLFNASKAKDAIDNNIDFLIAELEKKEPQTAYDVEDLALSVLLENLSHPMFNEIKQYIYYQPEEITLKDENDEEKSVKISLMAIVRLMGLDLRDRYLALHPEIK